MANHKSAEKRNRQNIVRRDRNRANRTRIKKIVKQVNEAIEKSSADEAQVALKAAAKVIDKVAGKGTIHRRNAARKISRLTKKVNAIGQGA